MEVGWMADVVYRSGISWEIWLWVICAVASVVIIFYDCHTGNATGYVEHVCQNGIGLFDILGIIFFAPLYLIYLLVAGAVLGFKFW